jgi:APA family basic amino acid/polyamine antiporter
MARQGDLPRWLAAVHPRYRVPHRAEITLTVIVSVLVLTVDVRGAIGFSSFGVLLYYLIANLSALTQPLEQRRFPRWLQVLGAAGCLLLVTTLSWPAIVGGLAVYAVGVGYRAIRVTISRP